MPIPERYAIVVAAPKTALREKLVRCLRENGYLCRVFGTRGSTARFLTERVPRLVLLGQGFGNAGFPQNVAALRKRSPLADVVPFGKQVKASEVTESFRAGARDFLVGGTPEAFMKRIDTLVVEQRHIPRLQQLRDHLAKKSQFEGFFSRSQKMWDVFEMADRVAETDATVLIEGETGTGKELLARAIYRRSSRTGTPFLTVNCGALTDTLLDSELFGHEKGAFTGASSRKTGLFEKADGGTLFLDEIGNISEPMQQRLLRVIETGKYRRVGGTEELETNVRFIAASNRTLEEAVAAGEFREDLYFRLNVFYLRIPALRERPEDILFLFHYNLDRFAEQYNTKRPTVSDRVLDQLLSHDWAGNVRELQNLAERLVLVAKEGKILPKDLPKAMVGFVKPARNASQLVPDISKPLDQVVDGSMERVEREYLKRVLEKYRGRIQKTADHAGISRRTLHRKMRAHGLDKDSFKAGR